MNEFQICETAYKNIFCDFSFKMNKEEQVENNNKLNENENVKVEYKPDSIVSSVMNKFLERSKIGKQKYGTDLDRTDLSLYEWIVHAQEEHMDAILYLEKIKQLIVKKI